MVGRTGKTSAVAQEVLEDGRRWGLGAGRRRAQHAHDNADQRWMTARHAALDSRTGQEWEGLAIAVLQTSGRRGVRERRDGRSVVVWVGVREHISSPQVLEHYCCSRIRTRALGEGTYADGERWLRSKVSWSCSVARDEASFMRPGRPGGLVEGRGRRGATVIRPARPAGRANGRGRARRSGLCRRGQSGKADSPVAGGREVV